MFESEFAEDPLIAQLRCFLSACRFIEVVDRTDDLAAEPACSASRARWRELLRLRLTALVVLVRYAEAEDACRLVLESAEADDDHMARARVLGYGLATAYFLGKTEEAVGRLDEVLATAEDMPVGPERMSTVAAAAIGSGMIGLTELSDLLLSRLVEQVATAPEGVVPAGIVAFLHALMTTRRCQLAIELEQREPAKSASLYRSVLDLATKIGVDLRGERPNGSLAARPAELYLAHLCFAKIAIGEAAEVEEIVRSVSVTGVVEPFDAVGATTEIMWGLCQLRIGLEDNAIDPARWECLTDRLTRLAHRTRTLVLQAETARIQLEVTRLGGDPLRCAAVRERYEAALDELDWTARLERARFAGLRSRTMRDVVRRIAG
ncbi:hypothetical protein [Lentzea sp. HUAS12]|uniref:hypothetical protein n=1 Tax=Lentzea sp. HUAS12 TaxID=2951806 RepID=UPI0020A1B73A|nr:hypothetical protein [Lentzea sp. HUAS12]USX54414.1 hypothetical protein ND450_10020 [Lentzea sp. HUAS12]